MFGILTVGISMIWLIKGNFVDLLTGKKVALVVSEEGVIDYTYNYGVGLVPWEEIAAIKPKNILFQKKVCMLLHHPKRIVKREHKSWKRWRMRWSIVVHQTPYVWESKIIALSQKDFLRLLQEAKAGTYDFNNLGQHLIEQ